MNITYDSLFDTVLLNQIDLGAITPAVVTKAAAKREAAPGPAMSVSLWRHTQNENTAEFHHQRTVRSILGGIAALGLGSTAYAVWQTGVLMSGSHLQDAVCAFLH